MRRRSKAEDRQRTCRIQRVYSPKTPQMPALSKISDNVRSQKEDRLTVNPTILEYTPHFAFHSGTARQAVRWLRGEVAKSKSAGVDRFADRCILIVYHGPRFESNRSLRRSLWRTTKLIVKASLASLMNELSRQRAE